MSLMPASRRPLRAAALLLTAAVSLTGCASAEQYARDEVIGIRPAPSEKAAAALTEANAQTIAQRALEAAAAAEKDSTATGDKKRSEAFAGPALTVARAHAQILKRKAATPTSKRAISADKVRVLSISSGKEWPRTIFATSTAPDRTQQLHLLVSTAARSPYQVTQTATMQGGAKVPAFDELTTGTDPVRDSALAVTPTTLLSEYTSAVRYPKPATPAHLTVTDAFTTTVRKQAAAQSTALKSLATFAQKHEVQPASTASVALGDGGAVVFGLVKRTDTVTLGPKAKSLTVPTPLSELIGKTSLTKKAELQSYESLVFTVPVKGAGKATLVAVDEQLLSGRGE